MRITRLGITNFRSTKALDLNLSDTTVLIDMPEDILPPLQSRQRGDGGQGTEEQRQNCFVAIARTKNTLILSPANTYRGHRKPPSRFLVEMRRAKG